VAKTINVRGVGIYVLTQGIRVLKYAAQSLGVVGRIYSTGGYKWLGHRLADGEARGEMGGFAEDGGFDESLRLSIHI